MESNEATSRLAALAQETRLEIFRALVQAHDTTPGQGGLAAGEISAKLGVPAATLSFHLKELVHAGLIAARREGRSLIYKADLTAMQDLVAYLLEDCCAGTCGVCDMKAVARR